MTLTLDIDDARRTAAEDRARRLGVSVSDYLAELIDRDIDMAEDPVKAWEEAARPIAEAFAGVSDEELEAIVDEARTASYEARLREEREGSGA